MAKGDCEAAEPLCKAALLGQEQLLGNTHPDILTSIFTLALLFDKKGDYHAAENLLSRCLQRRTVILGENHIDTLTASAYLADCLIKLSRMNEAVQLVNCTHAKLLDVVGPGHKTTKFCANLKCTF